MPLPCVCGCVSAVWRQFNEYAHVAASLGLRYLPLHGHIPPASFERLVWVEPQALAQAVHKALVEHQEAGE